MKRILGELIVTLCVAVIVALASGMALAAGFRLMSNNASKKQQERMNRNVNGLPKVEYSRLQYRTRA